VQVAEQITRLQSHPTSFAKKVSAAGKAMQAESLRVFQINLGKVCNQACLHCHVDASPARTEQMDQATAKRCVEIIASVPEIEVVDITGGAPEMNASFKYLVESGTSLGKHIIDRCNLTILEEAGYEYLYDFLASHSVEIVASLPFFTAERTDRQRGRGVFEKSIVALKKLNALGYGTELPLNLVHNPAGFFLSSGQEVLERDFKENLKRDYNIVFSNLYCLNNMPVSRFLSTLLLRQKYEEYMEQLVNAFNPATIDGLMCRHQISVSHDGFIYDCDFNQMLELKASGQAHVDNFDPEKLRNRHIVSMAHCFGCTAGAGSSCGGEIS
jgi:radical SAM/Cys-rich protein